MCSSEIKWDVQWGLPEVLHSGQKLIDASGKSLEYFLERIYAGDYGDYGKYDPSNTTPAMTDEEISKMFKDMLKPESWLVSTSNSSNGSPAKQQNQCHLNRIANRRFSAAYPINDQLLYFSINEYGRTIVCNYLDR
jgi:hypothetical protein